MIVYAIRGYLEDNPKVTYWADVSYGCIDVVEATKAPFCWVSKVDAMGVLWSIKKYYKEYHLDIVELEV